MEVRERPLSTADLAGKSETHNDTERRDAEAIERSDKDVAAVPMEKPATEKSRPLSRNNEELVPLFCDDVHRYVRSLREIRRYLELTPSALVVCGHDPECWPQVRDRYE